MRRSVQSMFGRTNIRPVKNRLKTGEVKIPTFKTKQSKISITMKTNTHTHTHLKITFHFVSSLTCKVLQILRCFCFHKPNKHHWFDLSADETVTAPSNDPVPSQASNSISTGLIYMSDGNHPQTATVSDSVKMLLHTLRENCVKILLFVIQLQTATVILWKWYFILPGMVCSCMFYRAVTCYPTTNSHSKWFCGNGTSYLQGWCIIVRFIVLLFVIQQQTATISDSVGMVLHTSRDGV